MESTQSMWDELFEQLQKASGLGRLTELQVMEVKPYLVRLGMVQPFDWMSWREPYPSVVGVATIDLRTAVMHVTRICRADRFSEGTFWCAVSSGVMEGLCKRVRELVDGGRVPRVVE
jgi:hypothetical protein